MAEPWVGGGGSKFLVFFCPTGNNNKHIKSNGTESNWTELSQTKIKLNVNECVYAINPMWTETEF